MLLELFVLCKPEELKIDIRYLISTQSIFYCYHCGCGNIFTSRENFRI